MVTYHFILIEDVDDDRRWILLDFFAGPVDQDLVEKKKFVPCGTEGFVDYLRALAKLPAYHSCEWIR